MESHLDDQILDALVDLQWLASADSEKSKLDKIVGDWINYSELISWVSAELKAILNDIEENVNSMKSNEDLPGFRMELSSLLNELGCPYAAVMSPPLIDRFESVESKKVVLNFLLSELEAGRMLYVNKLSKKGMKLELDESPTAKILKEICLELSLGKPPDNITAQSMWNNILNKTKNATGGSGILEPLFTGFLSPKQWSLLENYYAELKSDYAMRREMLLKRLDVTVQSFHWTDRLKGEKEEKMNEQFRKIRPGLKISPDVDLSDILAARSDLAIVEKTSSTSVRKNTRSAVNKVVIGRVPDRGGRPDEVEPPPPEMPSWQQRQGGPPSGASGWIQNPGQRGRGGGGPPRGGRGGGSRVQGGWSDQGQRGGFQQQQHSGGYQQQGSGHQQPQHSGGYQQQQDYRGGDAGYQQQSYGGGGGYNQSGAQSGGYYQHDVRGDSYQDQGRGGGGLRGQGHGNYDSRDHRDGGRGGGRGRRY